MEHNFRQEEQLSVQNYLVLPSFMLNFAASFATKLRVYEKIMYMYGG